MKKFVKSTAPGDDSPKPPDASLAKNEEAANLVLNCEADEYALLISQMKNDSIISNKFSGLFKKAKQGFTLVSNFVVIN